MLKAIGKEHYTSKGIFENKTFSVNIPAQDLLVETDSNYWSLGNHIGDAHKVGKFMKGKV